MGGGVSVRGVLRGWPGGWWLRWPRRLPRPTDPGRIVRTGVPLTAGLALAFVDQTLAAVTASAPRSLVGLVVEQECQEALRRLSTLVNPSEGRRTVRAAWAEVMVAFVDGVSERGRGGCLGGSEGLAAGGLGSRRCVGGCSSGCGGRC